MGQQTGKRIGPLLSSSDHFSACRMELTCLQRKKLDLLLHPQSEDPGSPQLPVLCSPRYTQGRLWGRKQVSNTVHTCVSHQVSGFVGNTVQRVGLSLPGTLQTLLHVPCELRPGMKGR